MLVTGQNYDKKLSIFILSRKQNKLYLYRVDTDTVMYWVIFDSN